MLTGEEKILYTDNNDICNYLGFALSAKGACKVEVKNNQFIDNEIYKIILVRFNDGSGHVCELRERLHKNMTINFIIKDIIEKRNKRGGNIG